MTIDLHGSIRVLHVEDDPALGELIATFLERADDRIVVDTETNASDGLDNLHDEEIDCIVSDYDMPGMDGLEFLRIVREEHPTLPFILFTGRGSEEIASEAITAGVTDYLQKKGGTDRYTILANRIANAVAHFRAIRETELNHQVMETANEGLSLVDTDGTFSYVNSAFAQLFGYEREELIGTHWTILYHNEEAERLENHILPAVRETGYWAGETVRLTKEGRRVVTDHRLAHTDEDVIVCTARNITAERSVPVERNTLFDLFADFIADRVFYALDHEGYITRWNEGIQQLKGYETDEILGEHFSEFFTETDRQQGIPKELLETARREGTATHEGWLLRKDGSQFWADETISASYDTDGTLRGFANVLHDPSASTIAQ